MIELDTYKPIFRKALLSYKEGLNELSKDEEITNQTLKEDIVKNLESVDSLLSDFDNRIGDVMKESTKKLVCLALHYYVSNLQENINVVRNKIGNLNIHFNDTEKEIKLAKEAIDVNCPSDWKYTVD